jgi:hypothetical protein
MSSSLSRFQDGFAAALFAGQPEDEFEGAALMRQPGFAVYRNTVMKGCIDALQANYPSVTRLVGEEWFRAAAAIYVRAHLPQDARMLYYGAGFAEFLDGFEPAAELPYLADVARLDRLWTEAHVAPDQPSLEPAAIADLAPTELADVVLHPHPAACWAWFDNQPVFTIWRRNREALEDDSEIDWRGEGALLTRMQGAVAWVELDKAGCHFLDCCKAGRTLAEAAAAALAVRPDADLASLLSSVLAAGAFCQAGKTPNIGQPMPHSIGLPGR